MEAYLILEDGTIFKGHSAGSRREVISEIVFNTSMTGYLEVLTDPSYAGQSVTMTYPLIGNYGISYEDMESKRVWPDALITRELSRIPENWRSENTIQNFLKQYDVPAITGVDTRALTKRLRDHGTMNGMITTKRYSGEELAGVIAKLKEYRVTGVVRKTTADGKEIYPANAESPKAKVRRRVALLDLGTKKNIIRSLQYYGCDVTVFPSWSTAQEILNSQPDGIMISNGPGDPKENTEVIEQIKILSESGVPIFAICLGHQLMALAHGADTFKLKYGHRGGNHPVKDLKTGRVYITSQNHGYAVDASSLDPSVAVERFRNVNDGTNEGMQYTGKNITTVQFHPEACPGPRDSEYLFEMFLEMMEG